jgi:carbon monoxide dehydrogenase subunit G
MLQFEGDKQFSQTPQDLWAQLSDARFLVQCIPDVQTVSRAEPGVADFVLRPGFSFARGNLDTSLRVEDAAPNQSMRVVVQSRGIGSRSTVEAALNFAPAEGGTRLHWSATIRELGGLLKMVPQGLIQAAAQKVIADVWASIEAKLGGARQSN